MARSTFRSQKCKKRRVRTTFGRSDVVKRGCFVAVSSKTTSTLHYATIHYTTLHYTNYRYGYNYNYNYATLHYTTLLYTTLHYPTLHCRMLHHHNYSFNCTTQITLHHNHNSTTLQLQLQQQYTARYPAVVSEAATATIATSPKSIAPTTFRFISGFILPSVIHNNQSLL